MAGGAWGMIAEAAADIGTSAYALDQARREARTNRDFQREMSNSAYQRAVKDLKLAGLNPILAAKTGGATTPSGSTAQIPNPPSMKGITASAMNVKQMSEGVRGQEMQNQQMANRMELEKAAMQYYRKNPDKQHALHEAIMAGIAGIRPELGMLSGLMRQGSQGGSEWSGKALDAGQWMNATIQEIWKKMNKKKGAPKTSLPRDGDITIKE